MGRRGKTEQSMNEKGSMSVRDLRHCRGTIAGWGKEVSIVRPCPARHKLKHDNVTKYKTVTNNKNRNRNNQNKSEK